ncbi:MAG: hypothetical protein WBE90_08405 [Xanthobacteraceae bacterium]
MRRDSSDIWVVDCSPEGHQPDVSTRIFQGVQQPVCIVLAARAENKNRDVPGRLRYVALPKGKRENKFEVLAELSLADRSWLDGAGGWRDPFLPEQTGAWPSFPALADLFVWSGPGVKTHRTWVISPDILTPMRASRGNREPAISFDEADDIAHFHAANIPSIRSPRKSLGGRVALSGLPKPG